MRSTCTVAETLTVCAVEVSDLFAAFIIQHTASHHHNSAQHNNTVAVMVVMMGIRRTQQAPRFASEETAKAFNEGKRESGFN
jgi:hypothetical protein